MTTNRTQVDDEDYDQYQYDDHFNKEVDDPHQEDQEAEIRQMMNTTTTQATSQVSWRNKFLFIIELPPHVSKLNMAIFYLAAMVTIAVFVFVNAAQPFVLRTYLKIPEDQLGHISGDLAFCNEIVIVICAYLWGILSDGLGSRKLVYICGFLLMGVGIGLYPFASSITVLFVFRVLFAIGAASTSSMLTAVLGDYTVDRDRGKAAGLLGVVSGLGAVFAAIFLLKLPSYFEKAHLRSHEAGYATYAIVALMSIVMCFFTLFGLKGKLVESRIANPAHSDTPSERDQLNQNGPPKKSLLVLAKEGIIAAKNPMILLSYIASFVARGDSVLITTFISLWVSQAMTKQHGATPADALARGGLVSGIAQICALVAAPIVGVFCDKVNRVGTLIFVSIISGIGYTMTHFLSDVTRGFVYFPICLIGAGEIGVIICSQILVTQSAPDDIRGSVSGVFTFAGALGIMMTTKVGGILFDRWRPSGPFVLIGIFNFLLAGMAVVLMIAHLIQKRMEIKRSKTRNLSSFEEDTSAQVDVAV